MKKKGTYRLLDGRSVPFAEARAAWARWARPILEGVAKHYNATITYQELADEAQATAGIVTDVPMRHWIGAMLFQVAMADFQSDEPILTSLCVHGNGTIGEGFADAIKKTYGEKVPEHQVEDRAARERFECYKYFGAVMPVDGGRPTLTKHVAEKRERAKLRQAPPPQPKPCPKCHLILPLSGRCNNCSATA